MSLSNVNGRHEAPTKAHLEIDLFRGAIRCRSDRRFSQRYIWRDRMKENYKKHLGFLLGFNKWNKKKQWIEKNYDYSLGLSSKFIPFPQDLIGYWFWAEGREKKKDEVLQEIWGVHARANAEETARCGFQKAQENLEEV